jgi:hypothetical protein
MEKNKSEEAYKILENFNNNLSNYFSELIEMKADMPEMLSFLFGAMNSLDGLTEGYCKIAGIDRDQLKFIEKRFSADTRKRATDSANSAIEMSNKIFGGS